MKNTKAMDSSRLRAAPLNTITRRTKFCDATVKGALWLALIVGLASQALAQTMHCGNISGTWAPSGNPHIVTCNATVPAGQTLTIQPGVTVLIAQNASITNNGLIQAVGTPTQRITFQPPIPSQYWNTIFSLPAAGTNRFKYCDFGNAGTALGMGIHGRDGTIEIEIMNCTFSNCVAKAIYGEAEGMNDTSANLGNAFINAVVKNCSFSSTSNGCVMKLLGMPAQHGWYPRRGYAAATIAGNTFRNLSGTAFLMLVDANAGGGNPIFVNNTIINSRIGLDSADPWDAQVQDNIFVGTSTAVKATGVLSRTVGYNCFFGNAIKFNGYDANYGTPFWPNRNGTMSDIYFNIFEDPLFVAANDLHLAENSPCIDAGAPGATNADVCFPPSQGSAFPDLGAYGGPSACGWPECFAPTIASQGQPQGQASCLGQGATFCVTALGTLPFSYQWRFNGSPLSGQTSNCLVLTNLQSSDAGPYSVVVSSSCGGGSVTSSVAQLVVNDACMDICTYAGLNIAGLPGRTYELRYTTDLNNTNFATWTFLATNTVPWFYIDTTSCGVPKRFYGVKLRP